jgi:hypothetical protein
MNEGLTVAIEDSALLKEMIATVSQLLLVMST